MISRRLFILDTGWAEVDVLANMPMEPERGRTYLGPVSSYLVTGDPTILIDTGLALDHIGNPTARSGSDEVRAVMRPENAIVQALEALGLRPTDVDVVINTHFDFDHCGGNQFFQHADYIVQKEHLDWASAHPERCPPEDWRPDLIKYRTVDGDHELFPWCALLKTPGHVVGHQSVQLTLPDTGTILIVGDAAVTHAMFEEERVTGASDEVATLASIRRLKTLRDATGATILIGHDGEAWRTSYRIAPAYYG
jgi:N-acyl homoserine lactone hydrolase